MDNDPAKSAILVRVRSLMPSLRPAEQRIGTFLLDDPARAAAISMSEWAASCETSTTSVARFTNRMGYQHFREMRADIMRDVARESATTATSAAATSDIARDDSMTDIVAKVHLSEMLSLSDTASILDVAQLEEAVRILRDASRIDIFGLGASSYVGQDLQQKLIRIGRTALGWSDSHAAWTSAATLDPQGVAMAVSHSGETADTVQFLRLARARGARTVSITNYRTSTLAGEADIVLTTAARESKFRSGALGSRIAQLMVVDCLFIGVAQSRYEESMEALRATYEAVRAAP